MLHRAPACNIVCGRLHSAYADLVLVACRPAYDVVKDVWNNVEIRQIIYLNALMQLSPARPPAGETTNTEYFGAN